MTGPTKLVMKIVLIVIHKLNLLKIIKLLLYFNKKIVSFLIIIEFENSMHSIP